MAASLSTTVVDAAPGNIITLPGAGLTPGGGAQVTVDSQGVTAAPNLVSTTITLPSVFNTTNVQITIPDGITDGTLTVKAGDGTTATCALRSRSQYLQASEYAGEGMDTSALATGELDIILRRASSLADSYMGGSIRVLQTLEKHKYRAKQDMPPKIYPWRTRGRRVPIVSVDQFVFVSAKDIVTSFNPNDMYVNDTLNYIEILAYAIGNYALLGALEIIGYSANVLELTLTSGYPLRAYPSAVCEATTMIATKLLKQRNINSMALGDVAKFEDKLVLVTSQDIPQPAKDLLRPYVARALA
jgi:hypothetical protein